PGRWRRIRKSTVQPDGRGHTRLVGLRLAVDSRPKLPGLRLDQRRRCLEAACPVDVQLRTALPGGLGVLCDEAKAGTLPELRLDTRVVCEARWCRSGLRSCRCLLGGRLLVGRC